MEQIRTSEPGVLDPRKAEIGVDAQLLGYLGSENGLSALLIELEPGRALGGPERFGEPPDDGTVPTSELAECTCPDFCERDHANE